MNQLKHGSDLLILFQAVLKKVQLDYQSSLCSKFQILFMLTSTYFQIIYQYIKLNFMAFNNKREALISILKHQQFLPWNFTSNLIQQKTLNLESPVNNQKYFPLQTYVGLFKDFAEALKYDDFDSIATLCEPSMRRKVGERMEEVQKELKETGLQIGIENNRKQSDETTMFLYDIENFFIVGADPQLNRDLFKLKQQSFQYQVNEFFNFTYPHLSATNEVEYKQKEIQCTQILNSEDLQENSQGLLVMRLHFLVTTYLNMYVYDPIQKQILLGNQIPLNRTIADKKSHFMTVDKIVARMHVGDTFLDSEEQIQDKVIDQFKRDEAMWISDFDNFMPNGNSFLIPKK